MNVLIEVMKYKVAHFNLFYVKNLQNLFIYQRTLLYK
jgi:hypothetical protein